jgi:hypothetical protein
MIFRAFDNPSTFNLKLQVYGRIALFTSMCVLQSIMLYMFWKFTRPAFRRIKVASIVKKKTTFLPSGNLMRLFELKSLD